MARKTRFAGIAAVAATAGITFASAEISGANAQQGVEQDSPEQTELAAQNAAPVFVSEEVVQPIPAQPEEIMAEPAEAPSAESLHELVSTIDTDYELSREMECLAGTVYFESRGEPLAGQLAVAQVVINRAESPRFPSSYCGVVYQRSQFSFVKGGRMPQIRRGSSAWKRAKAIARIAHEGHWESEAQDALYFHANYVRPSWSRSKARRAAINTHIFYR